VSAGAGHRATLWRAPRPRRPRQGGGGEACDVQRLTVVLADCFDAVISDLDGVITRTAEVHERAWRRTFDELLTEREGPGYRPLSKNEYRALIDGKPRAAGVRSFLRARGLALPEGSADDGPTQRTVAGLARRKNEHFLAQLAREGPAVFEDAVTQLARWREQGLRTAVVSSSRNCARVVRAAGLERLFDVRVDGATLDELGLRGKPAPDMFLEAAMRLGVAPERAVVLEDAVAGVRAARAGGFALVAGIDRGGAAEALRAAGAHVVVQHVSELEDDPPASPGLPDALACFDELAARLGGRRLVVFLDYDGTLTPIVDDPAAATLSSAARAAVEGLARRVPVAVVSGRDLDDVRARVGLEGVYYAGSHGFDIAGPGVREQNRAGTAALPALDAAEASVRRRLAGVAGAQVERKRFSIAVHYRRVRAAQDVAQVKEAVAAAAAEHPTLRRATGKKVLELQPAADWDKGRAVLWLLSQLTRDGDEALPLYIGDDTTDEDAFRALADRGVSVLVADAARPTAAGYVLADPERVRRLLQRLAALAEEAEDEA
jgi:trehalose-phosphatase